MRLSHYTIISKLYDGDNYCILNPLTKQADIITGLEMEQIISGTFDQKLLKQKGYVLTEDEEKLLYRSAYLDFLDMRDNSEVQIFFVPWYACNFACSYCYQSGYEHASGLLSKEVIDAFYGYITTQIQKPKYITLFGGEPLLESSHAKELISYFIEKANNYGLSLAIVTNGYTLSSYIATLKKASIREIQVTLDGTEEVHNARRYTHTKAPTFEAIVTGIDVALSENIPINLRVVVDAQNINNLPKLAQFAIDRGWTKNPLFKTQIGRNYELHSCQADNAKLFDRASLYEKIYALIIQHPYILQFHRPAFSISKFLFENGTMPHPLFDACPGCKTEWAFDYTGTIYPCTAMVGKKGEDVGTFYPEISLNHDYIKEWQNRDITTIEQCKQCEKSLLCGGGCAALAKNKTGQILSPDCRPQDQLLSMGISLYFEKGITHDGYSHTSSCNCLR
ncbi:MAG: radical SAM protein [Spirochaetes bacterium]|nr:radical SAM protein [Spirochaetota bacterium]